MAPIVLYSEESGLGGGDADVSLHGTGRAVPRGVEAVFQYNGLIMNDRSVIDKYRVISIDGLDDADIRDSRDENPADDGETPNNALYGGRTMAITGRVEAYELNKLRDMIQALRTAFADISQERPFHFLTGSGDTDHFINCKKFTKNQISEEQKHLNHFFRDFTITVRASDPRFYRKNRKSYESTATAPGVWEALEVANVGNYRTFPTVRIYGEVTAPGLTNLTTGEEMRLKDTVTIPADDFYEIDVIDKTIKDSAGLNKISSLDPTSDWMKIIPGTNYIEVSDSTVDEDGASFQVYIRDAWI